MSSVTSTPADLRGLDPAAIPVEYDRRVLASVSDSHLFDLAADVVGEPKAAPADSFVLHAPLELLARRALLEYVEPARRQSARLRLVALAANYEATGPGVSACPVRPFASPAAAVRGLSDAIDAGDLDGVDDAATWLGRHATADDLLPLADAMVPHLGAAAHAPIFLYALPRVAPRSRPALGLLRPLARELAREPGWRVGWIEDWRSRRTARGSLVDALLATPRLGVPGSDFIYPLMHQVDASGVAAELLAPVIDDDRTEVSRSLLRVAAWSMLQDDPAYAPYGWTHCLTLAQAASGVATATPDPARTLAVAATYVVGFRAALSTGPVAPRYDPAPVAESARDALDAAPPVAAAAVHHAPAKALDPLVTELATRAALHEDAHVVKYTIACLDAAHADPAHGRLYLAAAAFLGAWWGQKN
jgi:hypothetical protein